MLPYLILLGFTAANAQARHLPRRFHDFTIPRCIHAVYDSSCWDTLGLTQWLNVWNNITLPCTIEEINISNVSHCRQPSEVWTHSFLRIAQNITGGPSCTKTNACLGDSPTSKQIRTDVDSLTAARYRHVCYNIYGEQLLDGEIKGTDIY